MKNKKQLRLEDITYYSNNLLPNTRSRSRTPKTPQAISRSPKHAQPHTCTHRGIMRETVIQKLREYKYGLPSKYHKTVDELRYENLEKEVEEMKSSPTINKTSQKLYAQMKEKRNLSPKVLERFEQYERTKSIQKMKKRVEASFEETKRPPKPREIIIEGGLEEIEIAKKVITRFMNTEECGKPSSKIW